MSKHNPSTEFNNLMDESVQNVISQNLLTPKFRSEYVRAVGLFKKVAEYDVKLAMELYISMIMFSLEWTTGIVKDALKH